VHSYLCFSISVLTDAAHQTPLVCPADARHYRDMAKGKPATLFVPQFISHGEHYYLRLGKLRVPQVEKESQYPNVSRCPRTATNGTQRKGAHAQHEAQQA
jgi:hypothetical protein